MKELKEFVEALNKIANPVLKEDDDDLDTTDLELDNVGSELDQDDDDEGKGFKGMSMYDQLGKVLDSQGNPNPINSVTTDDGQSFDITPEQAKVIRMLMTTDKVKPMVRDKFIKDVQTANGLSDFVDIKDYHEIAQLFVTRYLG